MSTQDVDPSYLKRQAAQASVDERPFAAMVDSRPMGGINATTKPTVMGEVLDRIAQINSNMVDMRLRLEAITYRIGSPQASNPTPDFPESPNPDTVTGKAMGTIYSMEHNVREIQQLIDSIEDFC